MGGSARQGIPPKERGSQTLATDAMSNRRVGCEPQRVPGASGSHEEVAVGAARSHRLIKQTDLVKDLASHHRVARSRQVLFNVGMESRVVV